MYKCTKVQKYQSTKVQKYQSIKTQKYQNKKNTKYKVQKHNTYNCRRPRAWRPPSNAYVRACSGQQGPQCKNNVRLSVNQITISHCLTECSQTLRLDTPNLKDTNSLHCDCTTEVCLSCTQAYASKYYLLCLVYLC